MKKLIRRLSRVADSSQYSRLPTCSSNSSSSSSSSTRSESGSGSSGSGSSGSGSSGGGVVVPEGHLPVYVGDEMERFVVSAHLLHHPIFINLLNKSAQEYGYQHKGVLRIPCHVLLFQRLLQLCQQQQP